MTDQQLFYFGYDYGLIANCRNDNGYPQFSKKDSKKFKRLSIKDQKYVIQSYFDGIEDNQQLS